MYGTVEMVEGFTRRINKELGQTTKNIATGGLARVVTDKLETKYELDSYLTLDGLRMIYERVNGKKHK